MNKSLLLFIAIAVLIQPCIGKIFDVTLPPYSATGNGSTNDSAAVQSAMNALLTHGGGVLYFPSGTYKLNSAITNSSNKTVTFEVLGEGTNNTILLPSSNNGTLDFSFTNSDYDNICQIRNLTIEANDDSLPFGIKLKNSPVKVMGTTGTLVNPGFFVSNVHFKSSETEWFNLMLEIGSGHNSKIENCFFGGRLFDPGSPCDIINITGTGILYDDACMH